MIDGPVYQRTRAAWAGIWRDTNVARELESRTWARARRLRRRFLPYLPEGEPILEAGCGLGAELIGLADAGHAVVGVDYVTAATATLKRHRPSLRLAAGDVHALPFRNGAFGAYLSFGVLEHFAFGPGPALREANRVLRDGGVLVLTVPAPNLVWRLVRARRRLRGDTGLAHGYFETTYAVTELSRHVAAAGFVVVEQDVTDHEFTLWGLGRPFRGPGYYETSRVADSLGSICARVLPRAMAFTSLVIARKAAP